MLDFNNSAQLDFLNAVRSYLDQGYNTQDAMQMAKNMPSEGQLAVPTGTPAENNRVPWQILQQRKRGLSPAEKGGWRNIRDREQQRLNQQKPVINPGTLQLPTETQRPTYPPVFEEPVRAPTPMNYQIPAQMPVQMPVQMPIPQQTRQPVNSPIDMQYDPYYDERY